MQKRIQNNYFNANKKQAKALYEAVRKGLKKEHFSGNFKALFLVGGPGSGKDFLIHSVLDECNLKEVSLDKLYTAIVESKNIDELNDYSSIIVNGNAESRDKIIVAKVILESMGYDTSMIYVYTTDDESKSRNDQRISLGSKTFSEEYRKSKYESAVNNMHEYSEIFEGFILYDNTNNFSKVDEEKKKEIAGWLLELSETISGFLSKPPSDEAAIAWIAEKVQKVKPDCGCENKCSCGDKKEGGVAVASANSSERTYAAEEKKVKVAKKQSVPPSSPYDGRMAMSAGSQGVGGGFSEAAKVTKKKRLLPQTPMTTNFGNVANFGNPEASMGITGYKV